MVFSSFLFLFGFLPLLLLLYFAAGAGAKNAVLLVFSLLFYTWGDPAGVAVMLVSVTGGWVFGIAIERRAGSSVGRAALAAAVSFQLVLLLYFKYAGLLLDTVRGVTGLPLDVPEPGLPVGISFFTFHMISYLVDVYRGHARALRSYPELLLYISLFPQLVAGPIIRYADISGQLKRRTVTIEGFSGGVYRFAAGLAKKVVLADALAELVPVVMDGSPSDLSVLGAWLGALLFGLQIYFDFSGYSDMAIGLAAMFGFTLRENFDYPYVSRSAAEFWRRWNLSVGRFFRDYVYIPLGGGRKRALPNLLLVWLLTGLWHGASWNFVVWGLYFGVLIALERTLLDRLLNAQPRLVSHIYFTGAVLVGWVIFYFESLPRGLAHVRAMFGFAPAFWLNAELAIHVQGRLLLIALALVAATPLPAMLHRRLTDGLKPRLARALYANAIVPVCCLGLLLLSSLLLVGKTYAPFFYFRF